MPSKYQGKACGANVEDYEHTISPEEFRKFGHEVVDWIADYYQSMDSRQKVKPSVQPGYLRPQLPSSAPETPQSFSRVMEDFTKVLMPGVVHWQSPKFFAYFGANSSFPSMLAEMLMSATNMIGFSWASSPVSTELEMVMMDWLAQLVGLDHKFMFSSGGKGGGVIQGTASDAVFETLLAAKARVMNDRPASDELKLVAYGSDQSHSCFKKACMMGSVKHVRLIKASPENEYAIQASDLEAAMQADVAAGLIPFFIMGTIGTTSSCAVDPIADLASVARQHGAWIHVDAAYAGSAALCPDQRAQWFGGLENVDSYSFNPHKWMLTNFDCCALWVTDSTYLKRAFSLTPVYLQDVGNALDFKDWEVPLGRRFRALKLFFVLNMYGGQKLREYVRHHMQLAQWFAQQVEQDPRFELAAPQRFGLVCFRLRGAPRAAQEAFLAAINAPGDLFLIHTELSGQYTIRLAIGSTGTQQRHVQEAWTAISAAADTVLREHGVAGNGHVNGKLQ